MSELHTFSEDTFDSEVLGSDTAVLVEFTTPYCMPCKKMLPILEKMAVDFSGKAKLGKLDMIDHPNLAIKYAVSSAPTILFFKNGDVAKRLAGFQGEEKLAGELRSMI
ncbi:MAG: thioredoxin [Planctomycetes bacterium]|nr:thioredoxin [Planctomycetota bacterium]